MLSYIVGLSVGLKGHDWLIGGFLYGTDIGQGQLKKTTLYMNEETKHNNNKGDKMAKKRQIQQRHKHGNLGVLEKLKLVLISKYLSSHPIT